MKRKTSRDYGQYRATITKLRKMGMIRKGHRALTYSQYNKLTNNGYTREDIIATQTRHNVANVKEANIVAKELRKRYESKLKSKKSKRSTASIIKQMMRQAHDDITARLNNGEDRDDVLADYGY